MQADSQLDRHGCRWLGTMRKEGYRPMKCPACACPKLNVVDSRPVEDGNSIRRRRECLACGKRFTTFETIETVQIVVIKKDGSKELFDRAKLKGGIVKATRKRTVDAEAIVSGIENELQNALRYEVSSIELGELVLERLQDIDEISYVRFASVYREFSDVDTFAAELRRLKAKQRRKKKQAEEAAAQTVSGDAEDCVEPIQDS